MLYYIILRRNSISSEIPVYNFCTSPENPITWGDLTTKCIQYGLPYPPIKAVWYLSYRNNPNKLAHLLAIIFLHYLPAFFIDTFRLIIGKKARL